MEQVAVYCFAFVELGKTFFCFTFIAVDFPAAYTAAVLSVIFDETFHIIKWVAEKQTDLMRKI